MSDEVPRQDEFSLTQRIDSPTPGRAPTTVREVRDFLRADFAVDRDPPRLTLTLLRLTQWTQRLPPGGRQLALRKAVSLAARGWLVLSHVELPGTIECGPGLRLPHGGRGIVLHPNVSIGARAVLYPGVTMGVRGPGHNVARLGDDVVVYAYAVLAGPVTVGDGAQIGANVVLSRDLPAGARASSGAPVVTLPTD